MATNCPGCFDSSATLDTGSPTGTFRPIPPIDWTALCRLHDPVVPYESFCGAVDDHVAQLTASLEAIEKTILHLRALRNSRSIIHRLPTEILIHIFSALVLASDYPSSSNLIPVTHVCRRWRAVALDTPMLWTDLIVTDLPGTDALISRSKDSLLDVELQVKLARKQDFHRILDIVLVHDRLRSLVVIALPDCLGWLHTTLVELRRKPAPHLATLHLLEAANQFPDSNTPFRPLHFGDDPGSSLSTHLTPALRSLRLRPNFLKWSTTTYKNLSVLETSFDNALDWSCCIYVCMAILRLLARCSRAILRGTSPCLSCPSLYSKSSPPPASQSFSHTSSSRPPRAKTSLDVQDHYDSPYFPKVFPDDLSRLPGLAAIRTARFDIHSGVTVRLYPSGDASPASEPTVRFVLSDGDTCYILAIPSAVLESTETLVFSAPSERDGYVGLDWPDLYMRASRLRTLRLVRPDSEDLYQALDALAGTDGEFLCPALECLELAGITFDNEDEAMVEDVVRGRERAGLLLKRLVLEDVAACDDFVSRLRRLGVDVVDRFADSDSSNSHSTSSSDTTSGVSSGVSSDPEDDSDN